MELDLVTALTAANITVLQPSHIQQKDKPVDVPYLFVRLISVVCRQTTTVHVPYSCLFLSQDVIVQQLHFLYNPIITGKVRKNPLLEYV